MSIQGVSGSQQSGVCSAQPVRQEREHQTVTEMIRESREKIEAHRKNLDKCNIDPKKKKKKKPAQATIPSKILNYHRWRNQSIP